MPRFAKIILISLPLLFWAGPGRATTLEFNVDPGYDYNNRTKAEAFLHQIGQNAYFYVEQEYYQNLDDAARQNFTAAVRALVAEFDNVIYPKLTEAYGSEWKPGIDNDDKITVFLTRIKNENGGYFNSGDEYPKLQSPASNEREMIYLNVDYVASASAKSFLAHEFTHLITFNQKERLRGAEEEVWLNEGRAEYAPTLLGYDSVFEGSNIQKRVNIFLQKPDDPLTEWKNSSSDYGALNVFIQYLADHYGSKILADSMKSGKVGIPSLNEALKNNGFNEDFAQIFTDWTIAVFLNNCNVGPKYCYLNSNLKNLRVVPQISYLPSAGESSFALNDYTKNWAGNWFKLIGGSGTLKLEFIGGQKTVFKVPYLLMDKSGNYLVDNLTLDGAQRGTIYLADFGKKYLSLIILPSLQAKISGFNGIENYFKFYWSASVISDGQQEREAEVIKALEEQIALLQAEIARVQSQIAAILAQRDKPVAAGCSKITADLYYGLSNNSQVRCLQEFLKRQGPDIYPEGIVSGNFWELTRLAVMRFQEKYASEILKPLGISQATGYIGERTRQKINQLLSA